MKVLANSEDVWKIMNRNISTRPDLPVDIRSTWRQDARQNMNAFWAMVRKELIIMSRYPVNFIASFGQVFLTVAVFTLAASMFYRGGEMNGMAGYSGVGVYGLALFMFMGDTLWSIGYSVRLEQTQGTLEQLYLSPASKFASLAARVMNTLIWTGLLSIAASIMMSRMMGGTPFLNPLSGLYILIFTLSGTFGVGFAFAALTLIIKETASTAANLLQFVILILCANFFPFEALPPALLAVSRAIPLAYAVDAFRSTLMGFPEGFPELAPIEVEIVIVTLFGILMPLVGYWLYRASERSARRSGSLSEY
jgi:ABC-2 type transport system permease protein